MKKARKLVAALTVCAMAFTLTACGGGAAKDEKAGAEAGGEPVVIKLATTVNEQDSFQIAAEKFKEIVEEKPKVLTPSKFIQTANWVTKVPCWKVWQQAHWIWVS